MSAEFKPTRAELRRVQYLAREVEIEAGVTQRLGRLWYGAHRPSERSHEAFALSVAVAQRGRA